MLFIAIILLVTSCEKDQGYNEDEVFNLELKKQDPKILESFRSKNLMFENTKLAFEQERSNAYIENLLKKSQQNSCLSDNPSYPIAQLTSAAQYLSQHFDPNPNTQPGDLETLIQSKYPFTYPNSTPIGGVSTSIELTQSPFNLSSGQFLLTATQANLVLNEIECALDPFYPNNGLRPKIELDFAYGDILLCCGTPFFFYQFTIYQ